MEFYLTTMENLIQEGSDFSVEMDGKYYICRLDVNFHSVWEYFPDTPSWWTLDISVRQYEERIVRFIIWKFKFKKLTLEHRYEVQNENSASQFRLMKSVADPNGGDIKYFYPNSVKDWIKYAISDYRQKEAKKKSEIAASQSIKHLTHIN